MDQSPILYRPVFVGKTDAKERIVIYKDPRDESMLHIKLQDGELLAFSPGSKVETWFDIGTDTLNISVTSPEWTGYAWGSRLDLMEEEGIR
jgi:hypothetical protein